MNLKEDFEENLNLVKTALPISKSFDCIGRSFKIGDREAYLMFIDGFAKDDVMLFIMRDLQKLYSNKNTSAEPTISQLIKENIAYLEVETFTDIDIMKTAVLSGAIGLIVSGEDEGIIIDAREYPVRSPEDPESEKVTRGAKDGLVETVIFNTALIRRRIRDENLVFEIKSVGERSKTDVVIGYVSDLVNKDILQNINDKIDNINVESLVMAEQSLEELLIKKKWYNPLPQVRYTERPDIIAAHLMEGNIVIITDTSPNAMIIPATLFSFTQFAEDYYQNPLVGTYYRFMRFGAIILSLMLNPLWMMLAMNPQILPESLKFIGAKETGSIPLFLQFLILEFGMDLLRISSLHTPSYLGASFGIIGGLLVGEFAIEVGLFVTEAIFYTAVSAMLTYCIPNIEFGSAIKVFRLFLLLATGFFGWIGFVGGLIIIAIIFATTETFDKKRKYLWPLFPLNIKELMNMIFRKPITSKSIIKRKP